MASIDITTQSGAVGNGDLQLQNGAPMDGTLRFVTDAVNTASPLKLSTSLVQTTSTLKITTNDNPYIDAEDGAGNNRFTVGRDTGSQQVNVDFASNPGGSTTIVGAIRTYVDGVTLSEVMAFREDGNIGINTLTPGAKLDIHSASNVITQFNRTGAGKSWIQFQQAGTARWNTGYDNTNGNYTIYDAVNAADRMVVTNAGNVGIGTSTPNVYSTSGATNIVSIQATGSNQGAILDIAGTGTGFSGINLGNATIRRAFVGTIDGGNFGIYTNPTNTGTVVSERLTITSAGNVGIGTSTPTEKLVVTDGSILTQGIGGGGAFNILQPITPNTDARTWAIGASVAAFGDFGIKQSNAKDGDPITAGDTKFYISRFGNVGIGTSTPESKLHVADSVSGGIVSVFVDNNINALNSTAQIKFTVDAGGSLTTGGAAIQAVNVDPNYANTDLVFRNTGITVGNLFESMRITNTGNVGIGTSTPAQALDVNGSIRAVGGSYDPNNSNWVNAAFSTKLNSSPYGGGISLIDGTAGWSQYSVGSGAALVFAQGSTSTGVTSYATLTNGGYFRLATGGIQFNGDTAAANALDDYEEGTFTLSVVPATSGTISLSTNSARYTKIGRQVFIQTFITVASVSSPVGTAVLLQGLPFTIGNAVDAGGSSLVVWANANVAYTKTALPGFYLQNTTQIYAPIDASLIEANDEFFVTMTYTV